MKNYMKKSVLILFAAFVYIGASCQDKDFYKRTNHYKGLFTTSIIFPDSTVMTSANIGSTDWSSITGKPTFATVATTGLFADLLSKPTTVDGYGITNAMTTLHPANVITSTNITNWNTSFGWGNHSGLYRPITWVPTWTDVIDKPTTFTPSAHTHDYNTDIINKPPEKDLMEALAALNYLPLKGRTTTEINALVIPAGQGAIAYDITLGVYKVYKNGVWSVVITSN